MKPIIGVTPLHSDKFDSITLLDNYFQFILDHDAIPVMLSFSEDKENQKEVLRRIDGLLFTGGPDINPSYYHEAPKKTLGPLNSLRDRMEWSLLDVALEEKIPIFGICRGMQIINIKFGGTLYQDLPTEFPSDIDHIGSEETAHLLTQNVVLHKENPFSRFFEKDVFKVNTLHHQGIKELAPDLDVLLRAEDNLIEGYTHKSKDIFALQFHPEMIYKKCPILSPFMREFVSRCVK